MLRLWPFLFPPELSAFPLRTLRHQGIFSVLVPGLGTWKEELYFTDPGRGRGDECIRTKLANTQAPADSRPASTASGWNSGSLDLSNGLTISVPGGREDAFAKPHGLQLLPRPDGRRGHARCCGCGRVPDPPAGLLPQPRQLPDAPPQFSGTKVTLVQALPPGLNRLSFSKK